MTDQKSTTLKEALNQLEIAVTGVALHFEPANKMILQDLLKSFKTLKEGRDRLKDLVEVIEGIYQKTSTETLPNMFEEIDLESIKLSGSNFILNASLYANIPAGQEQQGFNWLKDNGLESLIQSKVNAKTLSSAVKQLFEASAVMPPQEAIKTYFKKHISIRKA